MEQFDANEYQRIVEKLEWIQNQLSTMDVKLARAEALHKEILHTEIAKLRGEFVEYKISSTEKMTGLAVKMGIIFTVMMAVISAFVTAVVTVVVKNPAI